MRRFAFQWGHPWRFDLFPRAAWEQSARRSASREFPAANRATETQSVADGIPTQSVGTRSNCDTMQGLFSPYPLVGEGIRAAFRTVDEPLNP